MVRKKHTETHHGHGSTHYDHTGRRTRHVSPHTPSLHSDESKHNHVPVVLAAQRVTLAQTPQTKLAEATLSEEARNKAAIMAFQGMLGYPESERNGKIDPIIQEALKRYINASERDGVTDPIELAKRTLDAARSATFKMHTASDEPKIDAIDNSWSKVTFDYATLGKDYFQRFNTIAREALARTGISADPVATRAPLTIPIASLPVADAATSPKVREKEFNDMRNTYAALGNEADSLRELQRASFAPTALMERTLGVFNRAEQKTYKYFDASYKYEMIPPDDREKVMKEMEATNTAFRGYLDEERQALKVRYGPKVDADVLAVSIPTPPQDSPLIALGKWLFKPTQVDGATAPLLSHPGPQSLITQRMPTS
jgi:hypothetical protein